MFAPRASIETGSLAHRSRTRHFPQMANDGPAFFEKMFGGPDGRVDMRDARCPKCNAADFVNMPDLYVEALGRREEGTPAVTHAGGITDEQILRKFGPPRRRSALVVALVAAVPLVAIAVYVFYRFGSNWGQTALVAAGVLTIIVLMTNLRRFSDAHFHARQRWNRLYMCRQCGQIVAA
jgi:hypothetical protein